MSSRKGNRGFANKAKSGSKAATSRWQQSAARAKLSPPKPDRKAGKKR
jgi:hypothetical protein